MCVFIVIFLLLSLHNKSASLDLGLSSGGGVTEDAKTIKCSKRERQALLKFKQGLADGVSRLSSWDSKVMDCCKWRGIRCSSSNQTGLKVTGIDLRASMLRGKIDPSLLELQHLKFLDLSSNNFGGNIPEFIGSFRRLQYLNLFFNDFAGPIPHQLGNLSNLQYLDLSDNMWQLNSGNDIDWLSHLSLLRHLDLGGVNLSKVINWVESISNLPLLENLHLRDCSLPDVIPPVVLSNSSSLIAEVDLGVNDLSNSIYSWLFNLTHSSSLVDVSLLGNQLKGPIPYAFGNVISLTHLNLGENQLEGAIPKSFANLSKLQSLEMCCNNLTGDFPEFLLKLYGSENSLEVLDLSRNQLGGKLVDFTRFSSLRQLDLGENQLNGPFPQSFQRLPSLVYLDLATNHIPGMLPDLSVFSSLEYLDLGYNKLNGTITSASIGRLSKLQFLYASSNSLKGVISEAHFSNLSNLQELDLSFNSLVLKFSPDWIPPFQLQVIRLASCKLGRHFPKWLRNQNKYSELDISGVGISDTVPSWFWDLPTGLHYLNLSYNQISGPLPNLSLNFTDNLGIDLSSNCFTGQIPPVSSGLTFLNLSQNKFLGSLSFLCAITGSELSYLDLSSNQLSGGLPNCWADLVELRVVNLADNSLSGTLPTSMGFLYQIGALQLYNNNFSGELPKSLKKCTDLRIIDLGGNRCTGKIPAWIGTHLTRLIVLNLGSNKFHGSLSQHICRLNHIHILDLSQNALSGKLPQCFNNFTALVRTNSSEETISFSYTLSDGSLYDGGNYEADASVQWKGQERMYGKKKLGLLKLIDLSSNKFSGEIPEQFAFLEDLVSLNLSRNNLTGKIIKEIGEMKMLETLDLSANRLSGEIPTSLAQLNFLSVLNLSNNSLSGKIPSSTQLQSLDPYAFSGNPQLCGPPLPNKCPGEETTVEPPTTTLDKDKGTQDNEDGFVTTGFYISMGLGFFVGFWAIFGTILFSQHWGGVYFKFLEKIIDWFYVTIALKTSTLRRRLL